MDEIKLLKFKKWLDINGAEILPVTNEWEAVRFKGSETGVLYKSGKFSNIYAQEAFEAFRTKSDWKGKPINLGREKSYKKQKKELLLRDGDKCFYCDKPLKDDITLEHLISLVKGGPNTLSNMVLAHNKCNNNAGNKTVVEKMKIAIDSRIHNLYLDVPF